MATFEVGDVGLARRTGRAQGDVDRGAMIKGEYLLIPATRNVLAYETKMVEAGKCCPDASGNVCRHAIALQILNGNTPKFKSEIAARDDYDKFQALPAYRALDNLTGASSTSDIQKGLEEATKAVEALKILHPPPTGPFAQKSGTLPPKDQTPPQLNK